MSTEIIILLIVVGLLIQFGLIYGAIILATERVHKYLKIQSRLLAMKAKKEGTDDEEIRRVFRTERIPVPF